MLEFKRDCVIALYLAGKSQLTIVRASQYLNMNKSFISRTIARCLILASRPKNERKNSNNIKYDPKSEGQISVKSTSQW